MNLKERVDIEVRKIKQRGEVPDVIWLGQSQRKELESNRFGFDFPVMFVSSFSWLTVSSKGEEVKL